MNTYRCENNCYALLEFCRSMYTKVQKMCINLKLFRTKYTKSAKHVHNVLSTYC